LNVRTAVELPVVPQIADTSVAKPLNEVTWQSWLPRGLAAELRGNAARLTAVKFVAIASFLATSVLWSTLAPYGVVVRFVLSLCSLVLMFAGVHVRRYVFAAVFGVLVLFYNPIFPVVSLSGDWQRALPLLSAVPFVMSLTWRERAMKQVAK
jgi:small-conductance mechanosensitive channel